MAICATGVVERCEILGVLAVDTGASGAQQLDDAHIFVDRFRHRLVVVFVFAAAAVVVVVVVVVLAIVDSIRSVLCLSTSRPIEAARAVGGDVESRYATVRALDVTYGSNNSKK